MPCRLNRRRLWTHRIILESLVHPGSSFLTLTYNEENLPDGENLVPRDLQLFVKRLRWLCPEARVRYFGVGEYGERSGRPHYHLALFGLGDGDTKTKGFVDRAWGLGHVYVGSLTLDSAAYIAGYVTKKLTAKDDPRLQGKIPEFARMSLRPGIGAISVRQIAEAISSDAGWGEIERTGDVPSVLKHGAISYPLGRYLRTKLREEMNFLELRGHLGETKELAIQRSREMLALYQDYCSAEEAPTATLAGALIAKNRQKVRNMEAREKVFNSVKGSI